MAKILNYYALCPINDVKEFLGLSQGAETGTIINTLGRNIISSVKLSTQKQVNSWTSLDKFTNKVVYDCKSKQYVGVFAKKWIRCWSETCTDINKVKKIKLAKPIQDLIPFENRNTIVLYTDGTCESLELAIDTRKEERSDLSICHKSLIIDDATEILTPSYFKTPDDKLYLTFFTKETEKNVVYLVRVRIEPESLQIMDAVTKIRLAREDQDTELKGYAVVDGVLGANLITIWSDRRIFHLSLSDDSNLVQNAPGQFSSMMNAINVQQPLSVIGISKNCIAIYGANPSPQEGGALILYNIQFNVVESKQYFKIFFTNSRLWVNNKYVFLAYGQMLAVVQFRISKEQLSDMVGTQQLAEPPAPIDTECINIDGDLEDMLRFEANANHELVVKNGIPKLSDTSNHWPVIPYQNEATFDSALRNVHEYDMDVVVLKDDNLPPEMLQLHLSSNINDSQFTVDGIALLAAELERTGFSETVVTEHIVPLIIKADLTSELVTCLRKYTNISEKCLVAAITHLLEKRGSAGTNASSNLNAALSCSFDDEHIREHLRVGLKFDHVLELLDYIYEALKAEDVQLEERPQNSEHFDDDQLLLRWFIALIDAHFHQFVISRNANLVETLLKWKELIDGYVIDVQGLKVVEALLHNLVNGKSIRDKYGSKWYSVEEVKLY